MEIGGSQNPPTQKVEQQSMPVVQAPLTGWQVEAGGAQVPAAQLLLQQPAPLAQVPPFAVQGVLHACVVGSQTPRQHCVGWRSLASL